MSILVSIILLIAGWQLIVRGKRGRAIDDHPVCRKCRFDLSGKRDDSFVCPECGQEMLSPADIEIGNRKRIDWLIAIGGAISLIGVVGLGSFILSVRGIDPSRFKPDWLLIHDASAEVNNFSGMQLPHKNTDELLLRVQTRSISESNRQKIVAIALAMQADRSKSWNPEWGDMIEIFQGKGQLSTGDWQKYLAQDEFATIAVRANCARGDRIPFRIRGELRGATPLAIGRPGAFSRPAGGVPGVLSYIGWSGGGDTTFDMNGNVLIPPKSWPALNAGPQSISILLRRPGSYTEKNPLLFPNLTCTGSWTLLPDGQKSVELYRDEAIAAEVQKKIRHSPVNWSAHDTWIQITCDDSPVDLPLDVFIRYGNHEWTSGYSMMIRKSTLSSGTGMISFPDIPELSAADRVDLVLRPSIEAASNTIDINRVLDHEFVFKDVQVEKK